MKKLLIIDRDGTLIEEPEDFQIDSFEKLKFLPGVFNELKTIANASDFELVMVSNQDGLGTDSFPENTFWPVQNFIIETLKGEGIEFANILIDPSFPEDNSPNRKPETGLMKPYFNGEYNFKESIVIGDRKTDVQFAQNLGAKAIWLNKPEGEELPDNAVGVGSWAEIRSLLLESDRVVNFSRKTKETKIMGQLNLDGKGESQVSTGLPFFDHMLDQWAKHGGLNLELNVEGDLEIDEHHTVEDTALALGKAFAEALGNKAGIQRYGFVLAMDDSLAQVAVDFGGRPWLVWEGEFTRERVGDLPTEMVKHFFKSFSDAAKCNFNIKIEGENAHHQVESLFKAFAKVTKQAVSREEGNFSLPTTKGVL